MYEKLFRYVVFFEYTVFTENDNTNADMIEIKNLLWIQFNIQHCRIWILVIRN